MMIFFTFLLIFLSFCFISSAPAFGTPIISNECGTLGTNNPIESKDCQTFKLTTGYCCYLTITVTDYYENGTDYQVEKTACIISPNNDPKQKAELISKFSYLNGDVLIECPSNELSIFKSYYMLFSICFMLIFL